MPWQTNSASCYPSSYQKEKWDTKFSYTFNLRFFKKHCGFSSTHSKVIRRSE